MVCLNDFKNALLDSNAEIQKTNNIHTYIYIYIYTVMCNKYIILITRVMVRYGDIFRRRMKCLAISHAKTSIVSDSSYTDRKYACAVER